MIPETKDGNKKTSKKIKFVGYEKRSPEIIVTSEINTSPKKKITDVSGSFLPSSFLHTKRPTPRQEENVNNNEASKIKSFKRLSISPSYNIIPNHKLVYTVPQKVFDCIIGRIDNR